MGVAADITRAVLDGVLPAEARLRWVAIACAWVHWDADDTDAVFADNGDAALPAARMAMQPSRITLDELGEGLERQATRSVYRAAGYLRTVTSKAPASVMPVLWNAARMADSSWSMALAL